VTTGTEIPRFAGEGEQVIVAAVIAVDPCETLVQIAAILESFQHLLLDRAADFPGGTHFIGMPDHALIERAFSRVTGAINLAILAGESIHAGLFNEFILSESIPYIL